MATYNLRRFAHADGLKAIARKHLLALLKPHKSYFDSRAKNIQARFHLSGLFLWEKLGALGLCHPK